MRGGNNPQEEEKEKENERTNEQLCLTPKGNREREQEGFNELGSAV